MDRRLLIAVLVLLLLGAAPASAQDEFVFGLVLNGPQDDRGWNQAHFEGGEFAQSQVDGTRMIILSIPAADSPLADVVNNLIDLGAQLIITTSDEFESETVEIASSFPDIPFINVGGDDALTGEAPANVGNVMGQMEWGKLIAGCGAVLVTETGRIGYLAPAVDFEARRFAASAYLGARYCFDRYAGGDPDDLEFAVTWLNDTSLDPAEEVNAFYDDGADVVIAGSASSEVIAVARQRAEGGEAVWAVPYNYTGACEEAPDVCLGVPYFNWGPAYAEIVQDARDSAWSQSWDWNGPDWRDINNAETTAVGFIPGPALNDSHLASLDDFLGNLSAYATNPFVPESIALWVGPLTLQDGTGLALDGQLVNPLDVWYLGQLLEGMEDTSE
jgi:simple sugar transport system substrate-binding protein